MAGRMHGLVIAKESHLPEGHCWAVPASRPPAVPAISRFFGIIQSWSTGGPAGLAMMAGAAILAFAGLGGSLFLRVLAALATAIVVAVWRASQSGFDQT